MERFMTKRCRDTKLDLDKIFWDYWSNKTASDMAKTGEKMSDNQGIILPMNQPSRTQKHTESTQKAHKFVLFAISRFTCRKNNTPKGCATVEFLAENTSQSVATFCDSCLRLITKSKQSKNLHTPYWFHVYRLSTKDLSTLEFAF